MGGYNGDALAVKSGGSGDVTGSHRLWLKPKTKQRIGSGVISEGHIYILNDPGVAECIELTTGKVLWEERLAGPGPKNSSWSSMVLAEGKLYVINQGGDTFVVKASPKFELLGVNPLGETSNSSLAVSDGELFIRTHKSLWCVGAPPKKWRSRPGCVPGRLARKTFAPFRLHCGRANCITQNSAHTPAPSRACGAAR